MAHQVRVPPSLTWVQSLAPTWYKERNNEFCKFSSALHSMFLDTHRVHTCTCTHIYLHTPLNNINFIKPYFKKKSITFFSADYNLPSKIYCFLLERNWRAQVYTVSKFSHVLSLPFFPSVKKIMSLFHSNTQAFYWFNSKEDRRVWWRESSFTKVSHPKFPSPSPLSFKGNLLEQSKVLDGSWSSRCCRLQHHWRLYLQSSCQVSYWQRSPEIWT